MKNDTRVRVMELKKKYKNKNFFLTTFYSNHYHCAAILKQDLTPGLLERINKKYSIWETKTTVYVLSKRTQQEHK